MSQQDKTSVRLRSRRGREAHAEGEDQDVKEEVKQDAVEDPRIVLVADAARVDDEDAQRAAPGQVQAQGQAQSRVEEKAAQNEQDVQRQEHKQREEDFVARMERLPNSTNALARKRHATRLHKTAPRTPLQLHLGDASVQVNAHASQRANKQAKKEAKKVAANNKTNPQAESKDEKKANVGKIKVALTLHQVLGQEAEPTKQADHVDGHSENRKPAKQAATAIGKGSAKSSNKPTIPKKNQGATNLGAPKSPPRPPDTSQRSPAGCLASAPTNAVASASKAAPIWRFSHGGWHCFHWKRKSPSANEKAQEKAKATTNTAATTNGTEVQESRLFPLKNHFAALANLEADASVEQTNLHDKQESKSKDREDEDTRTTAANASTPTLSSRRTNMAATRSTGESTSSREADAGSREQPTRKATAQGTPRRDRRPAKAGNLAKGANATPSPTTGNTPSSSKTATTISGPASNGASSTSAPLKGTTASESGGNAVLTAIEPKRESALPHDARGTSWSGRPPSW